MVWQMGLELVKRVYLLTATVGLSKDFGLRDQIRRASVSVPTNIAEGFERGITFPLLPFSLFPSFRQLLVAAHQQQI
jgi:hypothetical protein